MRGNLGRVAPLVEELCAALGCDEGPSVLEFHLRDGKLRQTRVHRGPYGTQEIEKIAAALLERVRESGA
jgi:hypothetical protein